jgi:murein DD-endopeptidase MepM/ murein hydrolase activator NlpD
MSLTKYQYNRDSCKYEAIEPTLGHRFRNVFLYLLGAIIVASIGVLAVFEYFPTPKEISYNTERHLLDQKWAYLDIEEKNIINALKAMQIDDEELREILELDSLSLSIRSAGIGGSEILNNVTISNLIFKSQVIEQYKKIAKLKAQLSIQNLSFDTLTKYAEDRNWNWSHIPAIQPVSHKDLHRLSTVYGMRLNPVLHKYMPHRGFDFMADKGTPIYATADGKVILARMTMGGFGNQIMIDHDNGYKTRFGHLQRGNAFAVKEGDQVVRGQLIGYMGTTGRSAGNHLHYEVLKNGKQVNPIGFFQVELNPEAYEKMLELGKKHEAPMD